MTGGGESAALRERDERARRLARSVFERPVVLEAGAGTGKTATLVARLLVWCLGPGWERHEDERADGDEESVAAAVLGGVTAITFTERASVEMADRLARELDHLRRGEDVVGLPRDEIPCAPDEVPRRAHALLTAVDALQVDTIHAFCRRLLVRHPLEAGLHPAFEVDADQRAVRDVIGETLASWLREAYGRPGVAPALRLLELGFGPEALAEALGVLVDQGVAPAELDRDPYPAEDVRRFAASLSAEIAELLQLIAAPVRAGKRLQTAELVVEALESLSERLADAADVEAVVRAVDLDLDKVLARLREWSRGRLNKSETAAFEGIEAQVVQRSAALRPRLVIARDLDPARLRAAFTVLGDLLARVRDELDARGAVTFADLLHRARDLLRDHPALRAELRSGLDQLLIDEVQDTDPVQYEIVSWLALDGSPDERPGLFLVGDPKQSIYSFRGADLAAYEAFLADVHAAGGERRSLCVNFRSVPPVLDEVECLLAPIMIAEPGVQPPFERLLPSGSNADRTGFDASGRRPVEHWISWATDPEDGSIDEKTTASAAREIEAIALARDIRQLHDEEDVDYARIAVLLRATTQQEVYLDALRIADIPYMVEGDRNYYQRREIIDAIAAVACILDPLDHLSLVAFLRSPVVGVPDAALIPLWAHGLPGALSALRAPDREALANLDAVVDEAARAVPDGVPGLSRLPRWPAGLKSGLRKLAELRQALREEPTDVFVERLRIRLRSEGVEAARFLGAYRVANLERFYRRLTDALMQGGDPHAVLRELRRGVEQDVNEEEASPGDETLDAVRVMSIHLAKGLDFDHVYLMELHHCRPTNVRRDNEVGRAAGRLELRLLGVSTLGFDEVSRRRERREVAEMVRTLYVATTRARERLVMAGCWPAPDQPQKAPADALKHIELFPLRRGRRPAAETVVPDGLVDASGVLWRLPAAAPGAADETMPAPADQTTLVDLERAARDADRLLHERRRAEARQAHALVVAASAASHEAWRDAGAEGTAEDEEEPRPPRRREPDTAGRPPAAVTRTAGVAVHRALEMLDLTGDPAAGLDAEIARVPLTVAGLTGGADGEAAAQLACELLEGLEGSAILARLASLAPHIVGREVAVIDATSGVARDALAVCGNIDLLYRDPGSGAIVVADYKTDAVSGADDLARHVARYAEQGRAYVLAVQRALRLEEQPRFELWFLATDRIVEVDVGAG